MQLRDTDTGSVADRPTADAAGASDYWYADKNPGGGVAGTLLKATPKNDLLGNIRALMAAVGITQTRGPGGDNDLLDAIDARVATGIAAQPVSTIGGTIFGLETELAADADHDITISPGGCPAAHGFMADAITKRLDAPFAAGDGNGGLSDGAGDTPAEDTYHLHLIRLIATGALDVYFDPDKDAANIPSGYSHICRITSLYTDSAANWVGYTQSGDEFRLTVFPDAVANQNPGTSAVTPVLPVPVDIQVLAHLTVNVEQLGAEIRNVLITSMDQDDVVPAALMMTFHIHPFDVSDNGFGVWSDKLLTDSLGRFRHRADVSDSALIIWYMVTGWTDHRRGLS